MIEWGCPVCIGYQWYVPWKFPTNTPDLGGTLCTPCNKPVGDNNEEIDIPTNIIEYETTHIDSRVDDNSELDISLNPIPRVFQKKLLWIQIKMRSTYICSTE